MTTAEIRKLADSDLNGREALEALERVVKHRQDQLSACPTGYRVNWEREFAMCCDLLWMIRAALRAGPHPDKELDDLRTQLNEAQTQRCALVVELSRLRARDKWIEEHAKPALNYYSTTMAPMVAKLALAALPTDPPAKGEAIKP